MVVDDSRSVSEAIRMMAIKSGARIRRADCVASAHKHMTIFRPDVALIDLGLPDGNGVDLARELVESGADAPGVLIISAAEEEAAAVAAEAAGAQGYMTKPIASLQAFQNAVLAACPGRAGDNADWDAEFAPDLSGSEALQQDLENAQDLLTEAVASGDREALLFCAQFLRGVAGTAGDDDLRKLACMLTTRVMSGHPGREAGAKALNVINERLAVEWAVAG